MLPGSPGDVIQFSLNPSGEMDASETALGGSRQESNQLTLLLWTLWSRIFQSSPIQMFELHSMSSQFSSDVLQKNHKQRIHPQHYPISHYQEQVHNMGKTTKIYKLKKAAFSKLEDC